MNYDTMTIESLADDCFRRSGYKINKADLISRITHLCENHKSEVNVALDDVSKCPYCNSEYVNKNYNYCNSCEKHYN